MKSIILFTLFIVGCASTPSKPSCTPNTHGEWSANCDHDRFGNRVMYRDEMRAR